MMNKGNDNDLLGPVLEVLRKNEPQLKDRNEIPDNVIRMIQHVQQRNPSDRFIPAFQVRYLNYAQRFLTAASVSLLVLFGVEEFNGVKKLNALETHTASVQAEPVQTISRRLATTGMSVVFLQQRLPGRLNFFIAKQYLSQVQAIESPNNPKP